MRNQISHSAKSKAEDLSKSSITLGKREIVFMCSDNAHTHGALAAIRKPDVF